MNNEIGSINSDMTTYANLSPENKAKCKSALITLTFDPGTVVLDMTSEYYLNATSYTTTTLNGANYINSVTFNVEAISSAQVKFYKIDATRDYTYPITNNSSIITFNYT